MRNTFSAFCRLLLLLPLIFGGAMHASGTLEWKTTSIEVNAGAEDDSTKAVFEFKNAGASPITIRNIQTSCGCTTASDARGTFQPGEKGRIEVNFDFQGRKGLQQKTILVETSDEKQRMQVLTLRVQIPHDIVLTPDSLAWEKGSSADPMTVDVTLLNPKTKLASATSVGKNFDAKFEELEAGKRYRVTVKPVATSEPSSSIVRLDFSDPAGRAMFLPVRIKN